MLAYIFLSTSLLTSCLARGSEKGDESSTGVAEVTESSELSDTVLSNSKGNKRGCGRLAFCEECNEIYEDCVESQDFSVSSCATFYQICVGSRKCSNLGGFDMEYKQFVYHSV